MRFNFRKVSALATSALMVGMTAGLAAAANYPAPFVAGGAADVGIVYGTGTGVSTLDLVEAGNIQSNLQSFMGTATGGTTTTSGEIVSLDTSATRIWLNTSLNTAKSTLTSSDLPTVLSDQTFSGDVEAKMTSTIKVLSGDDAGGAGSSKVIFARQPKSSNDPVIGITLGASTQPLYNASVTFKAINFSHADSEGESITLFGQDFTVSSDTDADTLVLLKEASKVSLDTTSPTASVTIDGSAYTLELVSASDTAATIKVTDSTGASESKEVSESDSKKIQGLEIGVTTADETNLKLSATVIAGAKKLTFEQATAVTEGSNADPIDGTIAYVSGTVDSMTELAVAVYKPDSSNDAILEGDSFVDPVFGSFKLDFASMSSPLDDIGRDMIELANSGDDTMTIEMSDDDGYTKSFEFVKNASNQIFLGDDSNNTIVVYEGGNLTEDDYVVLGNENYGHILQVTQIYNNTGVSSYTDDKVKLQDVMSGTSYDTVFTSEGSGTITIEGKAYTVTYQGSGDEGWFYLAYPTSDSASTEFILFPTIKTKGGALVALYQPTVFDLGSPGATSTSSSKIWFPDGDGYTGFTTTFSAINASSVNWTIDSTVLRTGQPYTGEATADASLTVGQLTYSINTSSTVNKSTIYLNDPETGAQIDQPALIIFEGKDDNSEYHAVVVDLEGPGGLEGNSADGIGVNDVLFTSDYGHYSESLASNSDITKDVDWWGTLTTIDAGDSDQKTITISYPSNQIYSQIFVGEEAASVTSSGSGGSALGNVLVKDTEVSSVSSKNLIVVGGSCINSVAANLVGGAYCGSGWTDTTGVGSGQFLIQSFGDKYTTGKIALLVAGYDASDTVNAATYLRTQALLDTTVGKKYIGTSATSAELQVA